MNEGELKMGIFFNRNESQASASRAQVVSFLNQKGGVGKTTMTFNSAHALAKQGHKVLCIDLDPQANLSLLFDIDRTESEKFHIHHLMVNSVRELKPLHVPALIEDVLETQNGVDLLPAGQELSGFELTVAGVSIPRQLILKRFLEKSGLLDRYDYIVIDAPPTLGLLVVNILCASQGVIVPFRPDEFSRKGLSHFHDALNDIAEMGITESPRVLAHIPNLVDTRRKQEEDDLLRIENELKEISPQSKMMSPFMNRVGLVKGQAQKKSVFDYNSKEYTELQEQFGDIAHLIDQWGKERRNEHFAN